MFLQKKQNYVRRSNKYLFFLVITRALRQIFFSFLIFAVKSTADCVQLGKYWSYCSEDSAISYSYF